MEISRHNSEVEVMQQPVSLSLSSKILVNDGDLIKPSTHNLPVDGSLTLYKVEVMASLKFSSVIWMQSIKQNFENRTRRHHVESANITLPVISI